MAGDVKFQVSLHLWCQQGPQVVDVLGVCQFVGCACEETERHSDVVGVPLRRRGLPVVRSVFLGRAVVVGPELSSIQHLLPMLHVEQTRPRRIMADQHIVPLVIIKRRIGIADVLQRIPAHFRVGGAEDDAEVCLEPLESWQKLMHSSQLEPLHHCLVVQQIDHLRAGMLHKHHRPEAEVFIEQALNGGVAFAEGDVHLHGALAVTDVADLLLGDRVDIGEDGGEVVVGHVLEGEVPEFLVLVGVELGVVAGVLVAPAVTQPHVVSPVGEHEARRLVLVVDQPGVRTVDEAVLQDDGLESLPDGAALALDAEHGENVAVLGGHLVGLGRVVEVLAIVQELELGLRVRAKRKGKREREDQESGIEGHWIFGDYQQSCNNGPWKTGILLHKAHLTLAENKIENIGC